MGSMEKQNPNNKKVLAGMSGGFFLVGLGLMFYFDIDFWPWILVPIGIAGFLSQIEGEGFWAGLQTLIWTVGLALLFASGQFWPGILVMIGLSVIVGALVGPQKMGKASKKQREAARKQKRKLKRDAYLDGDDESAYYVGADGEIAYVDDEAASDEPRNQQQSSDRS